MSEQQKQVTTGSQEQQQQQHGRHFLSDANAAAKESQSSVGRPILGAGGSASVMPDVAAHEWNVNVADFVPTPSAPSASSSTSATPSGDSAAAQMASQLLGNLRSALDREQAQSSMGSGLATLRRWARTRDDLDQLVRSLIQLGSAELVLCEPAAGLLAHLALSFKVSEKESPNLVDQGNSLSVHYPVFTALMRHCSTENDRLRRQLAAQKSATEEQANYALLFCLLYTCLPNPSSPAGSRQPAVCRAAVQLLCQLVGLSGCPAAFRAVHSALLNVGELLDADCSSPAAAGAAINGGEDASATPAQQLEEVYERLRQAVAHCRVGDVGLATDIIRLLELRASGWGRPPPGFAAVASVSNTSQSMTDDMYADYEQFLRDSGQL